jgi:hypothetical protein
VTGTHLDFDKILEAGVKLKKIMLDKKITAAKAPCTICRAGFLHGRLVGRKQHLHMWCDNCPSQMME